MKKRYFEPYGIKINYELKTYKFVGRDLGDSKTVNLGLISNLKRFCRKRKNREHETYAICNSYTEWESHIKKIIDNHFWGVDLIHWLYYKRNSEQQILEAVKIVLIPVYIMLISLSELFIDSIYKEYCLSALGALIILIIICSACILYDEMDKVNFYNDFIKIAESELMAKSKQV